MSNALIKCFLIIIISFSVSGGNSLFAQNRSFSVDTLTTLIDGNLSPYDKVMPGDTLLFNHGNRDFILIRNFHGEIDKPVVIINSKGTVNINTDHYFGISVRNCRYFKFTGSGDPENFYGFKIKHVEHGGGIGIGSLSSDFELDHISIENCKGAGINAKTDPDCSFTSTRGNFTQFNSVIHDNFISGVSNEGLYIGSTKYFGQVVNCGGNDTLLLPGLLDGVRVYNNIIKYTGWDGIQVSSASSGCEIYNNMIMYDSQSESYQQMSGILIGGGSKCDCYNNYISQGKGNGIENHGLGGYRIFNNIIVEAGRTFLPLDSSQMRHGIFVSDVSAQTDSSFYILNNDIISPKSDGIRFSSIHSKNNLVASNLIINPGNFDFYENGHTSFKGNDSYVMLPDAAADVKISNNYLSRSIENSGISTLNYTLLPGSVLIDSAYSDTRGIVIDFYNHPRPYGIASDIGAFEFNPAYLGIRSVEPEVVPMPLPFPNPVRTMLSICYQTDQKADVSLSIYNLQGALVKYLKQKSVNPGSHVFNEDVGNYQPGIFIYTIRAANYTVTGRFIKADFQK
jgi:hypothetical protein